MTSHLFAAFNGVKEELKSFEHHDENRLLLVFHELTPTLENAGVYEIQVRPIAEPGAIIFQDLDGFGSGVALQKLLDYLRHPRRASAAGVRHLAGLLRNDPITSPLFNTLLSADGVSPPAALIDIFRVSMTRSKAV